MDTAPKDQRKAIASTLAAVVIVIVVLQAAIFGFNVYRTAQNAARTECAAAHEGKTLYEAFTALAAPPAPNSARERAVKDGLAESRKLIDLANTCK